MTAQATERIGVQDEMAWEDQLFARYLAGCEHSFAELYAARQPILLRSLMRCFDQATAEDILQEAWIAAATKGHQFRAGAGASFRAWIGTIVRQQVALHLRKNRRSLTSMAAPFESEVADERTTEPLESLMNDEGQRLLQEAVKSLNPSESRAFHYVHIAGMSVVEAARFSGVPHATFKKRLHQSVRRVKVIVALKIA